MAAPVLLATRSTPGVPRIAGGSAWLLGIVGGHPMTRAPRPPQTSSPGEESSAALCRR
jgi:hypothetical protein